jgi:hypothetical protein
MYMALLALRKFLKEEAKGHDRWIWQQCLQYSISLMNDLGIEVYSNWRTLQNWHRKLALNAWNGFAKAPPKKSQMPQLFVPDPDAQEAFRKYGIQNLKELSVELMHEYVIDKLIPTLVAQETKLDFLPDDDDGDFHAIVVETVADVTLEEKEAFLSNDRILGMTSYRDITFDLTRLTSLLTSSLILKLPLTQLTHACRPTQACIPTCILEHARQAYNGVCTFWYRVCRATCILVRACRHLQIVLTVEI